MHTTNLREIGGSVVLTVPRPILDLLHLEAGASVELLVEKDRLVVRAASKPRYTLDELLAMLRCLKKTETGWADCPFR
jgi:antitoxin ChpS